MLNQNKMKIYKISIKIVIEFICCAKLISSDCGLPAIPFNAQINQVKHNYLEGESIEYHCELDGLVLLGNSSRTCRDMRWVGTIPRCVEELDYKLIGGVEMVDTENHTLLYDKTVVYIADYKPDECISSTQMTRPHTWKLLLTKAESHISYIEIQVMNKNNKLNEKQTKDIISFVKINDRRKCESRLMDSFSNKTFRINLTCSLEFNISTVNSDWDKDQTDNITFEVNDQEFTICQIKIYKTPKKAHHWCGSADIVSHSRREFIRKNSRYGGNSHYRYYCDQGFYLSGNQDVRCGVDNNWLDEFPVCIPWIVCPIKPLNNGTLRHLVNTVNIETNITAVVGSVFYYFCEEDPNYKSIMIGSSVSVCDDEGEWSGLDPICIPEYKLEDFLEHFEELNENREQLDSYEPFKAILRDERRDELSCGIPAMPLFAKPITQPKDKYLNRHADLRSKYPNGTVIGYQCESASAFISGDLNERTCVNGTWVGNVGKCAINLGNKFILNSIILSHLDEHGESVIDNIYEVNNSHSEHLNDNFVFKYDPVKNGLCYNFTADKKQRLSLKLESLSEISYFMLMLYPGGLFDGKIQVIESDILRLSPLTAKTYGKQCVLTSAWDSNNSKVGTYFHFTCDLEANQNTSLDDSGIVLEIDPDKINKNYKTRRISLCSLGIFASKKECGTPDIPLHSSVMKIPNFTKWIYSCDTEYELMGPLTAECSSNGHWKGEFPVCRKKEACTNNDGVIGLGGLRTKYKNLMKINDTNVAVIGSVADYNCVNIFGAKSLLIGPRLRVCHSFSGFKWSGSEPFCLDTRHLSDIKVDNHLNVKIISIVVSGLTFMLIVCIIFSIARKMKRKPEITINDNSIDTPYTL